MGDAVQPGEGLVSRRDLVGLPPGGEESVGDRVFDRGGLSPAMTVRVHVAMEPVVELGETSISTGHINP
jgi:hypothetical protein